MLEALGPHRLPAMSGCRPANVGGANRWPKQSVAWTQL